MIDFEVYRSSALASALAYPDISAEHRNELETGDEQAEMTISACYKQGVRPSICALTLYWQDQYNRWDQPDEISAERLACRQLVDLQSRYGFRL